MSEERDTSIHEWMKSNIPLLIALAATVLVLMVVSVLAHAPVSQDGKPCVTSIEYCTTRLAWFFRLEPNQMGDTLAGIFGSLTLIWVVASVFNQSSELRAQRREFAEMVRAQDAQVKALEAQAVIFSDEKLRRDESEAKSELDELLIGIRHNLLRGGWVSWDSDGGPDTGSLIPSESFGQYDEAMFFRMVPISVERTLESLQEIESRMSWVRYPAWPFAFDEAERDINRILVSVRSRLSEAMKVRVDRLNLFEINQSISSLRADTSIWGSGDYP